jgi:hypothetical protein
MLSSYVGLCVPDLLASGLTGEPNMHFYPMHANALPTHFSSFAHSIDTWF